MSLSSSGQDRGLSSPVRGFEPHKRRPFTGRMDTNMDTKTLKRAVGLAGTGVWEDMCSMGPEALRGEVLKAAQGIQETQDAQAADEGLADAQAQVRELRAPYQDALKAQRARTALALYRLAELGQPGA